MGLPNDFRLARYLPLINYHLYRSGTENILPGILTALWCNSPVCRRSDVKTSHCPADPVLRNNQQRKYRVSNDATRSSPCTTGRGNPWGGRSCRPLASALRCCRETKAMCPNAHLKVIYFNWFTLKSISILSIINSKLMEELFEGCKGRMEKASEPKE